MRSGGWRGAELREAAAAACVLKEVVVDVPLAGNKWEIKVRFPRPAIHLRPDRAK